MIDVRVCLSLSKRVIDSQAANLVFAEEEEEAENDDMLLCPSEKANEEAMLNLYI